MIEPSPPMRQEMHELPDIPLPDALWQRVEAGRRQKMRRRKLGTGIATLALVAVMATPLFMPLFTGADAGRGEPLVAHQSTDRGDIQNDLRVLDQALQAAYDRGADDAEIAPMWVARNALLASLQSAGATSPRNRT